MTFTIDNYIEFLGIIVTIIIASIGGAYALKTNRQKFELTEEYRKELLQWYSKVVFLMIHIINYIKTDKFFEKDFQEKRIELLAELSAMVEIGRFYFPNIDKKDGYGIKKPIAYRGYRHICLELIMAFYDTALQCEDNSRIKDLLFFERNFTAIIFDVLEPRKRRKKYSKVLELTLPEDKTIEDFIIEYFDVKRS